MIIMAADPGATGGIVVFQEVNEGQFLQIAKVMLMPIVESKSKKRVDIDAIYRFVEGFTVDYCVIENVHSFSKQGVASAFQFGRVFGALEGVMAEISIAPLSYLEPGVWKPAMDLSGKDKEQARMRAARLFSISAMEAYWPLKKHDGIAEACLMGFYWYTRVL